MAKQRVVNTRFWDDDYVMELDPNGKLLFLYFITNPLTDLCGAYQITLKRMAFDTGLKPSKIQDILSRFEADGKICHRDGWLIIRNFGKHQQGNSPNVKKGAERSLSACPDWIKQTLSNPTASIGIGNALLLLPRPEPLGRTEPPALEIHLGKILTKIKQELGLKKLSFSVERQWANEATLAFENDFSDKDFLECFSLLRQQVWRSGPVTPANVSTNLSNLAKLRAEIGKQQKNGTGEKLPTHEQNLADAEIENMAIRKAPKPVVVEGVQ